LPQNWAKAVRRSCGDRPLGGPHSKPGAGGRSPCGEVHGPTPLGVEFSKARAARPARPSPVRDRRDTDPSRCTGDPRLGLATGSACNNTGPSRRSTNTLPAARGQSFPVSVRRQKKTYRWMPYCARAPNAPTHLPGCRERCTSTSLSAHRVRCGAWLGATACTPPERRVRPANARWVGRRATGRRASKSPTGPPPRAACPASPTVPRPRPATRSWADPSTCSG
jgi:hypothetical protein